MEKNDEKEQIKKLLKKAIECEKSDDALRFSQAALNCSHVVEKLLYFKDKEKKE
jgi:hypothetical protein